MSDIWDFHKGKIVVGFVASVFAIILTVVNLWDSATSSMNKAVDSKIESHALASEPRIQILESKVEDIREEQKEQRVILDNILMEVKK